ncbi:MAG: Gfo/Idh/MocA family oxidoreductase, partial [Actinomycetota bacterium]
MAHRVGIIGLGTVGSRFVEQFGSHDAFDLVAAWDHDAAACADHEDRVTIVASAEDVVAASELVYIAVPPLFHATYVEACVGAGRAIFCEKPLGIDVAESRRLVEAVEGSERPAAVNFVFGAAPSARRLLDEIAGGAIGDIVRADLRFHFCEWPRAWHARAQWLTRRDQGGWVREVASHFVFLAERLLGPLSLSDAVVGYPDGPDGHLSERWAAAEWTGAAPLTMA